MPEGPPGGCAVLGAGHMFHMASLLPVSQGTQDHLKQSESECDADWTGNTREVLGGSAECSVTKS